MNILSKFMHMIKRNIINDFHEISFKQAECYRLGSFDPFTIGHESIVEKALTLFDLIYLAIGKNNDKKNFLSPNQGGSNPLGDSHGPIVVFEP